MFPVLQRLIQFEANKRTLGCGQAVSQKSRTSERSTKIEKQFRHRPPKRNIFWQAKTDQKNNKQTDGRGQPKQIQTIDHRPKQAAASLLFGGGPLLPNTVNACFFLGWGPPGRKISDIFPPLGFSFTQGFSPVGTSPTWSLTGEKKLEKV